jgi:hypothetical protein
MGFDMNPQDDMQITQEEYELNEVCASLSDEEAAVLDAYIQKRIRGEVAEIMRLLGWLPTTAIRIL